jgi:hypothetical protein
MKELKVIIVPRFIVRLMSHILKGWIAITIGYHTFAARVLTHPEMVHEMTHAQQWEQYGITFPVRYLYASWKARKSRSGWYYGNKFEAIAYQNEYLADYRDKMSALKSKTDAVTGKTGLDRIAG